MNNNTTQPVFKYMWIALLIPLGIYLWALSGKVYDPDLAILTSFAQRILNGGSMSAMAYDPNPPLSFIVYMPVLWIKGLTGMAIYNANFIYSLVLLAASFVLSAALLKRFELEPAAFHTLLGLYLITQVMVPALDFGDRDHVIMLGLIPFLLAQLAIWKKIELSKTLLYSALAFGTIAVLMKPHYGLLPTVFIVWRFFARDKMDVLRQPDFLALAGGVIAYLGILLIAFPDYLFTVLPDSIGLYAGERNITIWKDLLIYGVLIVVYVAVLDTVKSVDGKNKKILTFLFLITVLLYIPYAVQGKALDYHRIPFLSAFYMTVFWGVFCLLKSKYADKIALSITMVLALTTLYGLRGFPPNALTHQGYKDMPFAVALDKYCDDPCSYLMLTDNSDHTLRLGVYENGFHASRFTSMWFLPAAIKETLSPSKEQFYLSMLGQDMERFHPDTVIVLKNLPGYDGFDFIKYFERDSSFLGQWKNYELAGTLSLDRTIYYPGYTTAMNGHGASFFEIYKRQ